MQRIRYGMCVCVCEREREREREAYDHVNWSFVSGLMHTMGFGPRMSRLTYLLGQDAVSRVMLNGGVTSDIFPHKVRSSRMPS